MDLDKRAVSQSPAEERPLAAPPTSLWGSDAIAAALRALEVPYIALVPGASYRGLSGGYSTGAASTGAEKAGK